MLRSHALKTVRQEHDDSRKTIPLILGTDNELINHDLRCVDEISKLRLPDNQPIGAVETVAVLETKDACLGKWAIVNLNRRLIRRQVFEGTVGVVGDCVVNHRMAMAECAPLAVLTRDTDSQALHRQTGER